MHACGGHANHRVQGRVIRGAEQFMEDRRVAERLSVNHIGTLLACTLNDCLSNFLNQESPWNC